MREDRSQVHSRARSPRSAASRTMSSEVTNGMECGVGLNFNDMKEGDVIEAFTTERTASDLGALVHGKPAAAVPETTTA